jgi:small subunit ribosomal protein S9
MAKQRKVRVAQYYVYDPETFEILTQPGQHVPSTKVRRLRELGLYEVALVKLPIPPGFQPQAWGKKKKAIACVRLTRAKGRFLVNGESLDSYFSLEKRRDIALEPFKKLGLDPKAFTVEAYVTGGNREEGKKQPRAIAHAVAGALSLLDDSWRLLLIRAGFRLQFDSPKQVKKDDC